MTKAGEILGEHKGIAHYTIGQRKGLNLALGKPVFVTEIRPETNEVVIGEHEDVFTDRLACGFGQKSVMRIKGRWRLYIRRPRKKSVLCLTSRSVPLRQDRPLFFMTKTVLPGEALFYKKRAFFSEKPYNA